MRIAGFADLEPARAARDLVVLDVRRQLEWNEGHVTDAVHVPLHELLGRVSDVPGGEVWVHCGTGYRAAIAASILSSFGRDVVLVNDEYANAADAGVTLEEGKEVAA
jgi:rhodanese-related sulfurtransferase